MGIYIYHHDEKNETIEVFQKMNDVHVYSGISGNEEGWRRIYTSPQAIIDSDFDPNNKQEFMRRGAKYNDIGSLMDKSRELSEKRAQKEGYDPQKKAFFEEYSRTRNGAKHPLSLPKKIDSKHAVVDL